MEVKVDIDRYLPADEIKEIVEDEVRSYVCQLVKDYFRFNRYEDFITSVATKAYWEAVNNLGEDTMGKIRWQVRKVIPKITQYSLLGNEYVNGKEVPKRTQQIINEEAEKLRPEFADMMRAAFRSALDREGPEIVGDTVAYMLRDALEERSA